MDATTLLKLFFGVNSVQMRDDGTILCSFTATSADGAGEETRKYAISEKNTPEKNMEILSRALEQKRWYATERSDKQSVAPPPPPAGEDDEPDLEIRSPRDSVKEFELDLN